MLQEKNIAHDCVRVLLGLNLNLKILQSPFVIRTKGYGIAFKL